MSSLQDLRPGDIGFGPIKGAAGMLVNAGQLMLGEGFRVGRLNIKHVFMVTQDAATSVLTDQPYCVEAMPSGARQYPIGGRWTADYAYVRLPEDYPGQAADAAAIARAMIGTPYSFASYAALAAWRFGLSTPRLEKWIDRRKPLQSITLPSSRTPFISDGIRLPEEAICSVLPDQAWSLTGKKIFDDGRPHQCVTPGVLAGRLLSYPGAEWIWPGR